MKSALPALLALLLLAPSTAAAEVDDEPWLEDLDEALEVCRRLWTEEKIAHRGEFFEFETVMFEPKPIQSPHPPILVGGESPAALRRAARVGDGWIGMWHTPESARAHIEQIDKLRSEYGTANKSFQNILGAKVESRDDLTKLEDAGVTGLIVRPFANSREAVDGIRRFADQFLG